jgi:hypothetical protein
LAWTQFVLSVVGIRDLVRGTALTFPTTVSRNPLAARVRVFSLAHVPSTMSDGASVRCACGYAERFEQLRAAREALARHATKDGHDPEWTIHGVATGVTRAGEEAGVCGRPDCGSTDSALHRDDL